MSSNGKRILVIPVVLTLAVGAAAVWYARADQADAPSPQGEAKGRKPLQVQVEPVRRGEIVQRFELSGEIVATDSVVIAATKEGPVGYCPWREGDTVVAGERLVEIDRQVYRAEVQAAQAALAVARAKLADLETGARPEEVDKAQAMLARAVAQREAAETELTRIERLRDRQAANQNELDVARTALQVAEAEVDVAREGLRMLQAGPTPTEIAVQAAAVEEAVARRALAGAHLAECVITAPFDGTITRAYVRPGDLVTPRSPLLEMYARDSLVVRFSVPEAQASGVRPGLRLQATLDALNGRAFNAEITRVYPQLDETMRTRTVEAKLTDPAEIVPHMFARLKLEWKRADDAVLVPAEAVLTAPTGEHYVFVVDQGKAQRLVVEPGIEQDGTIQALGGLEPGQRVVVAGQAALRDGQDVRVAGGQPRGEGPAPGGNRQATGDRNPGAGAGR